MKINPRLTATAVDEKLAAKYPFRSDGPRGSLNGGWGVIRLDGAVIKR